MTDQITAPWTVEQVNALNRFQQEANMHPFTCGALHASGQSPVLEATLAGWMCPDLTCDYVQDWAHAFMADPDAWPKFPFGGRHGTMPEFDPRRRYLVPVARIRLPDEPEVVHLALYEWVPRMEGWLHGTALCGVSTEQGPLAEGTEVTCPGCQHYQPTYQAVLDSQGAASESADERRRRRDAAGDTTENGAWHTVWLESDWRWVTSRMTTPQREYAADRVAAYSRYLETVDGAGREGEPEGLRWWREEAGR